MKSNDKPCAACDQGMVKNQKVTLYNGNQYHTECFKCRRCSAILSGHEFYMLVDEHDFDPANPNIHCPTCYEETGPTCDYCNDPFPAESKIIAYNNLKYHDQCFTCTKCNNPLGTGPFFGSSGDDDGIINKDNIRDRMCETCFKSYFPSVKIAKSVESVLRLGHCALCKRDFNEDGIKIVTHKNVNYHARCLNCAVCSSNLSGKMFTTDPDNHFICENCSDRTNFKCSKCNQTLVSMANTLRFSDVQYHEECCRCSICGESLKDKSFEKINEYTLRCMHCKL
ncbi:hypothetical protein GJ496_012039 [Pomphorhynchus laevis]|nr:hypothetical protein GJ496_012039 [Pomphorhynchus laevis]